MTNHKKRIEKIEDNALEPVPLSERKSWLSLSWNTVGIVTTLVALYIGALLTFVAGFELGLIAGSIVAVVCGLLGWGVGHVAYESGLASSVLSRVYGFGVKGSALLSSIFGFMMIGFLAAENVLIYEAFLVFFEVEESLISEVLIYGALIAIWILLTTYGFEVVSRFSSVMLIAFLAMLFYLITSILGTTGQTWMEVTSFSTQMPDSFLKSLGITSQSDKLIFCVNVLAGSGGALALLAADLGRYARRSSDIGLAVGIGGLTLGIFMVAMGGVVMYASLPLIIDYYTSTGGISQADALEMAVEGPEKVAAAFILTGGVIGSTLILAAQSKAQVLNSYSSSLSLSNLFDAVFSWRPGRLTFVIMANLMSIALLFGDLLFWFHSFLEILGLLTTSLAMVIISDYYIVRPITNSRQVDLYEVETINYAGVVSLVLAFILSYIVLDKLIPIRIVTPIVVIPVLYSLLRIFVFKQLEPHAGVKTAPDYQVQTAESIGRQSS
jgi:cytosine permease